MDEHQQQLAKMNAAVQQLQRVVKHLETQRNEAHTSSIEKSVAADIMQESLQRRLEAATEKVKALQEALKSEIANSEKLKAELAMIKTDNLIPPNFTVTGPTADIFGNGQQVINSNVSEPNA
jgi:predicted RNase H-like nuclease (RuvC/YqgF family)